VAEFRLTSIDWDSVQLLHAAHLSAETAYQEELLRWVLQGGLPHGVIFMGENDLVVSSSSEDYEAGLLACRAITSRGYIIEVDETNRPIPLRGRNSAHTEPIVPIFLEVREKRSIQTAPAQSVPLKECRGRQWSYALVTEPSTNASDWLQIGQMRKEGARFVQDTQYIPECLYLDSHPVLKEKIRAVVDAAQRVLEVLQRYAAQHLEISRLSAAMVVAALSPAAGIVHWRVHPYQWLQRLAEMLFVIEQLIQPWRSLSLSNWTLTNDKIINAIRYFRDHAGSQISLWEALDRVEQAITALKPLCEELHEPAETPKLPETRLEHIPVASIEERTVAAVLKKCPRCNGQYTVRAGVPDPGVCPKCVQRY